MVSLVFRDAAGNQQTYIRTLYNLKWVVADKGGPLTLTACVPIDLIGPKVDLLYDVSVYDELDEIWLGRVSERPIVTLNKQAAIITAEGYLKHLDDDSVSRHYLDTSYASWAAPPKDGSSNDIDFNASKFPNKNSSADGLLIGTKDGQAYATNDRSSWLYTPPVPGAVLTKFSFNWATWYTNAYMYLSLYSATASGSWGQIWSSTGDDYQSGSQAITLPANTTRLVFQFFIRQPISTGGGDYSWYGRITSPVVQGVSLANYRTDTVLKDVLATLCPTISTDYSQIAAGAYTLPYLMFVNEATAAEMLNELNKYELYDWGFYDRDISGKPRITFTPHDMATVHYTTSLKYVKPNLAGSSLDGVFNKVKVDYQDISTTNMLTTTRTKAIAMLTAAGITRSQKQHIKINSTSLAAAQQAGDTFLNDKARPQGKGSLDIIAPVRDQFGTIVPLHRIKPGKNILICGLEADPQTLTDMTSSSVLNGRNIFCIVDVDVDYPKSATLQLDNLGDRLDFLIARQNW